MSSTVACPVCQSQDCTYVSPTKDRYQLRLCANCGLAYTDPVPSEEELIEYYQGYQFQAPNLAELAQHQAAIEQSLRHFLGPLRSGEPFLDYGGGCGIYAATAQRQGCPTTLYEVDEAAIKTAREELHLSDIHTSTEGLPDGHYAYITCIHVIEHVPDLSAVMKELWRLLAPGGQILLATPHAHGWEKYARWQHLRFYYRRLRRTGESKASAWRRALARNSYFCWDPPRHLWAFTAKSFEILAGRHGFSCQVHTGYNLDPVYDPRGYVIQPQRGTLKQRLLDGKTQFLLLSLQRLFPRHGEQLYAVMTKPKTSPNHA